MKLTVLVVDDHKGVRDMVASILQEEGHEVLTAADLTEARDLFASRKFDLVFCDNNLGPGEFGYDFLKGISILPEVPVLILMSGEDEPWGSDPKPHFITEFLKKPFRLERIRAIVRAVMHATI